MSTSSVVISECDLYRYELPFTAPLHLNGEESSHRRGLLVRVSTEQGHAGWGDAAPLPGFSAESRSEVEVHARSALSHWPGMHLSEFEEGLVDGMEGLPLDVDSPSSFRFAMESAAVEVLAAVHETAVPDILGEPRQAVTLNALLPRADANARAQALRWQREGYQAIKVKVGGRGVEEDVARVRAVREALDASVALRVDANRAWSLDEAVTFAENVQDLDIAYVEEPLADPTLLSTLVSDTRLPVALDETTRETTPSILRDLTGVSAVVLKPTLLGGLQRTWNWGSVARETDTTRVLSAAYESGVGLRMLVALAAIGPEVPVGLSTYDRLATDVYAPPLPLRGPRIDVASVMDPSPSRIAWDRIELVERFSA